ncbi:hypothetical protein [Parapedobacter sp. DT-150]|uniref:hypothetical protein n=1 Tax=Parapedobacter sp. DT-150 TaxID=3396162 RepID=UPI003F1D7625
MLLLSVKITIGQQYEALENKEIGQVLKNLFNLKPENAKSSGPLFASDIYCMLCEVEDPIIHEKPYNRKNEEFIAENLADILSSDWLQRAKVSDNVFIEETPNDPAKRSDYIVFFTTHKKDEMAKGHEGALLGIYLKRENGELKISGFETIP